MDLLEILTDLGIEEDVAKKAVKSINKEIPNEFVIKSQYNKKVLELDETKKEVKKLQGSLVDAEAKETAYTTLQEKYEKYKETVKQEAENKQKEFDDYKNGIEMEQETQKKKSILRKALIDNKVLASVVDDFMLDKINVTDMIIENDSIKNADEFLKPHLEKYSGYVATEKVKGTDVATPLIKTTDTDSESDPFLEGFNDN